ncbi:MAG: hypothetical protein M3Z10_02050 [Gemmatimonadota bacterium]|nr:hypothetical protein [Gemmatimonadota bacterium]
MKSSTAIASIVLATGLAAPSGAQYRAPTGVQRLELSTRFEPSTAGRRDTTERPPEINAVSGIIGGLVGGAGGALAGTMIGAQAAAGCHGELCQLGPALLGFGLGESIGLAVGTHFGARGRGDVALSALTSVGIMVGGVLLSAAAGEGMITLPLVPFAQLAAALAMER